MASPMVKVQPARTILGKKGSPRAHSRSEEATGAASFGSEAGKEACSSTSPWTHRLAAQLFSEAIAARVENGNTSPSYRILLHET